MERPRTEHMVTMKKVLRYEKGTIAIGLWYARNDVYSDSHFAGDADNRKSTTRDIPTGIKPVKLVIM